MAMMPLHRLKIKQYDRNSIELSVSGSRYNLNFQPRRDKNICFGIGLHSIYNGQNESPLSQSKPCFPNTRRSSTWDISKTFDGVFDGYLRQIRATVHHTRFQGVPILEISVKVPNS